MYIFCTSLDACLGSINIVRTKYIYVLHSFAYYYNVTKFIVSFVQFIAMHLCLGVNFIMIVGMSLLRIIKRCKYTLISCLLLYECAHRYSIIPVLYYNNCFMTLYHIRWPQKLKRQQWKNLSGISYVNFCYNDWK